MNAAACAVGKALCELNLDMEFGTVMLVQEGKLGAMIETLENRISRLEEEIDIVSGPEQDARMGNVRELRECRLQALKRLSAGVDLDTDAQLALVDTVVVAAITHSVLRRFEDVLHDDQCPWLFGKAVQEFRDTDEANDEREEIMRLTLRSFDMSDAFAPGPDDLRDKVNAQLNEVLDAVDKACAADQSAD